MGKLNKHDEFVKKMQTSLEVALLYKIEEFIEEFMCSNDFVEIVEGLIKEGEFDDAVYDRLTSSNELIGDFCDSCEEKCTDDCPGRRLKG